jgi:hypothetical protein
LERRVRGLVEGTRFSPYIKKAGGGWALAPEGSFRGDFHPLGGYSIFGIGVDQKHALKWLFSQEKATLYGSQKVYMYSENALNPAIQLCSRRTG